MFTSSLRVSGLIIYGSCSAPVARFTDRDLIPNPNSLLSPNVSIDALPATIVNVYAGKGAGSYTAGAVMYIIVEFSKDVGFSDLPSKYSPAYAVANASYTLPSGLPYLELSSQSYATLQGYAGNTSRKLAFLYLVGTGEYTPDGGQLEIPAGVTIQLNGGDIFSLATGQQADLTSMPLPGTPGESGPRGAMDRLTPSPPPALRVHKGVCHVARTLEVFCRRLDSTFSGAGLSTGVTSLRDRFLPFLAGLDRRFSGIF